MSLVPTESDFNYGSLTADDVQALRAVVPQIRAGLRQTAENVVHIGQLLVAAKARVPYGQWLSWLHTEVDLSERTAQSFMRAAERFGDKTAQIADLAPSIVALLAAPSTPDAVVEGVLTGAIAPIPAAVRAARDALVPAVRKSGALPGEGIGERVRRAFAANRAQRQIASYIARLLIALDELYDLEWNVPAEIADACMTVWRESDVGERVRHLGDAASDLLAVATALGYAPDAEVG